MARGIALWGGVLAFVLVGAVAVWQGLPLLPVGEGRYYLLTAGLFFAAAVAALMRRRARGAPGAGPCAVEPRRDAGGRPGARRGGVSVRPRALRLGLRPSQGPRRRRLAGLWRHDAGHALRRVRPDQHRQRRSPEGG